MPVKFVRGDLFQSDAEALVNTVNCAGAMGKGIALEFKKRFPAMHADYQLRCERGEVRIGEPYIYQETLLPPWIVNFPTKQHWRGRSKLIYIEQGLEHLAGRIDEWGISSLAVPPLGCGHGGLRWSDVKPVLAQALAVLPAEVTVFEP